MERFHLFIVKQLNLAILRSKGTPLLLILILAAQISCLLIFIMSECSLLISIVPFNSSIAVTSDKLFSAERFPLKTCAWIPSQSWCVSYIENFSFVNVVNSNLAVGTSCSNEFIIRTDFYWKNLSMYVAKKINHSGFVLREVMMVKFQNSRTKMLFFCTMLSVLEYTIPFFKCDFLFYERWSHYSQLCLFDIYIITKVRFKITFIDMIKFQ
jgi:hypothetical protein